MTFHSSALSVCGEKGLWEPHLSVGYPRGRPDWGSHCMQVHRGFNRFGGISPPQIWVYIKNVWHSGGEKRGGSYCLRCHISDEHHGQPLHPLALQFPQVFSDIRDNQFNQTQGTRRYLLSWVSHTEARWEAGLRAGVLVPVKAQHSRGKPAVRAALSTPAALSTYF